VTTKPTERTASRPAARATDLALITTFASLIAACALLPAIPVAGLPVPITLQTLGVALAGAVLGARRGSLAVLLYLLVGLAGAPVFSGGAGGLGVLARPSAGYLVAFPLAALLTGWLTRRVLAGGAWARGRRAAVGIFGATTAGTMLVIHPLGIAVLGWRLGLSPAQAALAGAVFIPGDLVKNVFAAITASAVHRAFPDLLGR
jgi:biotin transport system substrate-specific component